MTIVDFSKIVRYDEERREDGGNSLEPNETGRWIDFDEMVIILASHGIGVKSFETIHNEKFEAEMVEKYGKNWRD